MRTRPTRWDSLTRPGQLGPRLAPAPTPMVPKPGTNFHRGRMNELLQMAVKVKKKEERNMHLDSPESSPSTLSNSSSSPSPVAEGVGEKRTTEIHEQEPALLRCGAETLTNPDLTCKRPRLSPAPLKVATEANSRFVRRPNNSYGGLHNTGNPPRGLKACMSPKPPKVHMRGPPARPKSPPVVDLITPPVTPSPEGQQNTSKAQADLNYWCFQHAHIGVLMAKELVKAKEYDKAMPYLHNLVPAHHLRLFLYLGPAPEQYPKLHPTSKYEMYRDFARAVSHGSTIPAAWKRAWIAKGLWDLARVALREAGPEEFSTDDMFILMDVIEKEVAKQGQIVKDYRARVNLAAAIDALIALKKRGEWLGEDIAIDQEPKSR